MENCGRGDFAQVCDIDIKQGVDIGGTIFSLFFRIPYSYLVSIMNLKSHTEKNSTCVQEFCAAAEFKDYCLTRQLGEPSLVSLAFCLLPELNLTVDVELGG